MKKKTILFGSLLAVFLMLMIPNVSAVEYQTVADANESYFLEKVQNIDIEELKEKVQNIRNSIVKSGDATLLSIILAIIAVLAGTILSLIIVTLSMVIADAVGEEHLGLAALLSMIGGSTAGAILAKTFIFAMNQSDTAGQKIIVSILSGVAYIMLILWIFILGRSLSKDSVDFNQLEITPVNT